MKLSISANTPGGFELPKRNPELDEEDEVTEVRELPKAESTPHLGTLKKRGKYPGHMDFDDHEKELAFEQEEVSQVREVKARRMPNIVPPPGGAEMLQRRQEHVRANTVDRQVEHGTSELGARVLTMLKNARLPVEIVNDRLRRNALTLKEYPGLLKELVKEKESLEALQSEILRLPVAQSEGLKNRVYEGITRIEDARSEMEKWAQSSF